MTRLPFYQVDAFASRPFEGNPAAVIPLDAWLPDATMQAIAAENNLSETAFTVPSNRDDADYDLRWFTPTVEEDLCGHATMAAGHILMHGDKVRFATQAGILTVTRGDGLLRLDLPAALLTEGREAELCRALGVPDAPVWLAEGHNDAAIILLEDEAAVRSVSPNFAALRNIHRMAIVTAAGDQHAIASRVFVSYHGIDEDPVTGAAHAALVPFWAARLGRNRFTALQASRRTGLIECEHRGDRVLLGGQAVTVIEGHIQL